MKRGVVIDISATVQSIEKSVEEAELVSGHKIKSAFFSISGKHIQSLMLQAGQLFQTIKKYRYKISSQSKNQQKQLLFQMIKKFYMYYLKIMKLMAKTESKFH